MKKQLMGLVLAGLLVGPSLNITAGIDKEDLQKMSANSLENQAWRNGQDLVGVFASLGLVCTIYLGIGSCLACQKNDGDAILFTGAATACGLVTTGLYAGWYQIFKKRAKKHGYKKDKLKFFFVDWMSRWHERR